MESPEPAVTARQGLLISVGWMSVPSGVLGWLAVVLGLALAGVGLASMTKPAPFGDNMAGVIWVMALYAGLGAVAVGLLLGLISLAVGFALRVRVPQAFAAHRFVGVSAVVLGPLAFLVGGLVGYFA